MPSLSRSQWVLSFVLATAALSLQPTVKTTQRARLPPASGKCKKCKEPIAKGEVRMGKGYEKDDHVMWVRAVSGGVWFDERPPCGVWFLLLMGLCVCKFFLLFGCPDMLDVQMCFVIAVVLASSEVLPPFLTSGAISLRDRSHQFGAFGTYPHSS